MKPKIKILLAILIFPFFLIRIGQICWEISGMIMDDFVEWLEEKGK